MLRFAVNLGFFYTEAPFLERFRKASEDGFPAVEFFWPGEHTPEEIDVAARDAAVEVALFNMDEGDYAAGERGFAGVPDRRDWWRDRLRLALRMAETLGCGRVNVLAGDVPEASRRDEYLDCLVENLRWAAPLAESSGVTLLVEPLNAVTHPRYLCPRTADVLDVLDRVGHDRVALQYDVYQAQRGEGDIVATVRAHSSRMAHIQVADAPDRGRPGTGELNIPFILGEIESSGYRGFVGLEYNPPAAPADPFAWLRSLHG